MNIPDKIYLQWHGDSDLADVADGGPHAELEQITWSEDRIFNGDVGPYVLESAIKEAASTMYSVLQQHPLTECGCETTGCRRCALDIAASKAMRQWEEVRG
jgi:hypothetical protein